MQIFNGRRVSPPMRVMMIHKYKYQYSIRPLHFVILRSVNDEKS